MFSLEIYEVTSRYSISRLLNGRTRMMADRACACTLARLRVWTARLHHQSLRLSRHFHLSASSLDWSQTVPLQMLLSRSYHD